MGEIWRSCNKKVELRDMHLARPREAWIHAGFATRSAAARHAMAPAVADVIIALALAVNGNDKEISTTMTAGGPA